VTFVCIEDAMDYAFLPFAFIYIKDVRQINFVIMQFILAYKEGSQPRAHT